MYHRPVLLKESLELLDLKSGGVYVDATFGGGGHSGAILEVLGPEGRLIAFDQDPDAEGNLPPDDRLLFVNSNFRHLKRYLRFHGFDRVDGILADLGVSSHQLDVGERGFSYRFDARLDMRMDQAQELDAARILNEYPADRLQEVFSRYGEIRNARTLAREVVAFRKGRSLVYVSDLLALAEPLIRGNRARYLAQLFQALRMEVNDELGVLKEFLLQTLEVLKPGGRLVVIAYHSIEDRAVKHFLRTGDPEGHLQKDFFGNIDRPFELLTRKALEPTADEITENNRARSAKLRAGVKK